MLTQESNMIAKDAVDCLDADASRVFKFDGLYQNVFLLSLLLLISILFTVRELTHGYYVGALVMLAISASLFTLIYVYLLVGADIHVDDSGISRYVFGRLFQSAGWNDIYLIRISGGFGKSKYSYNIYSRKMSHKSLGINGKIAFGDDMANVSEFVNTMNAHIAKHGVKIESIVGGFETFPARLPESKRVRLGKIDPNKFGR